MQVNVHGSSGTVTNNRTNIVGSDGASNPAKTPVLRNLSGRRAGEFIVEENLLQSAFFNACTATLANGFFFPRIRIIVSLSLFDYADSAEQKLFDQMVQKVQSLMKEEPNFLTALGELCNTTNKEIEVLMLHGSEKKAQDLGRFLALFVSVKGIAEAIGDGARLDKQKGRFARAVGGLEELCYPKSTTEPNLAIHSPTTTTTTASTTTTTTMSYGPGPHSDAGGRKEKKSREKGNKNDPSSSVEQVGDDKKAKRAGTDKAGKSSKPGGKIKRLSMKFLMPKEAQVLPTAAQLREVDGILIGYGDTWSESSRERERLGLNKNFPAPQEPHESWGDD